MRIIPAIDIIDGQCVRLTQGDYSQKKIYNSDPLDTAKLFEDHGMKYLHLVDLEGAKAKHVVNWRVLEKIASKTSLSIDFGGGVKSSEDLRVIFECGASQVTGGSIAVQDQVLFESWLTKYGAEKIILGADAKGGKIAVQGWQDETTHDLLTFVQQYVEKGVSYVICTDIEKDGLLSGTSIDLYQSILQEVSGVKLIASGGVTSLSELETLAEMGVDGAIVGKAIYEETISLKELSRMALSLTEQ